MLWFSGSVSAGPHSHPPTPGPCQTRGHKGDGELQAPSVPRHLLPGSTCQPRGALPSRKGQGPKQPRNNRPPMTTRPLRRGCEVDATRATPAPRPAPGPLGSASGPQHALPHPPAGGTRGQKPAEPAPPQGATAAPCAALPLGSPAAQWGLRVPLASGTAKQSRGGRRDTGELTRGRQARRLLTHRVAEAGPGDPLPQPPGRLPGLELPPRGFRVGRGGVWVLESPDLSPYARAVLHQSCWMGVHCSTGGTPAGGTEPLPRARQGECARPGGRGGVPAGSTRPHPG